MMEFFQRIVGTLEYYTWSFGPTIGGESQAAQLEFIGPAKSTQKNRQFRRLSAPCLVNQFSV